MKFSIVATAEKLHFKGQQVGKQTNCRMPCFIPYSKEKNNEDMITQKGGGGKDSP